MKIAIFDCFSGISGDMTVGAFLDLGLNLSLLRKRLHGLDLDGYKIDAAKVTRNGISGTKFEVIINPVLVHKGGVYKKKIFKRVTYKDIKKIISQSRLKGDVKRMSLSIFDKLVEAEAKVHHIEKEKVHFHEIGDVDSIIDIVSTAIAVKELDIEKFYCLNLKLGKGNVASQHGNLPLPAPAVLELLKDKPISFSDVEYELVTPTGAAILTTLVEDFNSKPEIRIEKIGYGAGSWDLKETPDLLRIILGKTHLPALQSTKRQAGMSTDMVLVIETNIDDMNPVSYEYLIERLFEEGALDVYLTPVYMKKTRPGILFTVLAKEELLDKLAMLIMKETTTSGIRYYRAQRQKLDRVIKTVKTKYGAIRVKVNTSPGIRTVSPEYEDCKKIARKTSTPFKVVFDEAKKKLD